jgi:APA family basic amino acid/polyamine antiporter
LPLIASLGVMVNLLLIINLDKRAQLLATGWMLLGVIVYFVYSKKNSNLEKEIKA